MSDAELVIERGEVGNEARVAVFSVCGLYRYRLDIVWDSSRSIMATIGLNPSTADHLKDDPTIRKCKRLAMSLEFGGYRMLNAFALRSTDYRALFRSVDPVGPANSLDYLRLWANGPLTIACWGAHITERQWAYYYRGRDIVDGLNGRLSYLRLTKDGHPEHPLYLPSSLRPKAFPVDDTMNVLLRRAALL